MDWLDNYIVLVIVGICYCIGYILKHIVASEKLDRFIPVIMGACGVFFNIWLNGWSISPEIILGGLASGLAATGTNQIIKQLGRKENEGN